MAKNQISRRTFLKGLAAGAASLATLGVMQGLEYAGTQSGSSNASGLAASAGTYIPGTYTASATGLGTVTMTATFDETRITDIQLDVSQETADIGGVAADELVRQCLAAQSSSIDGISGATLTTNAVKKCLDDCIAQATGQAAGGANAANTVASDDAWLGEPPEITDDMVEETIAADVLVIGCGVAGVAAVRAAAEEGASVVAIEKASGPQCRSGEYAVINGGV